MHFPLQAIHDLVFCALHPSQLTALKETALAALWQNTGAALARLPADMLHQVCLTKTNGEKKTLVRSYQSACIAMANQLHQYGQTLLTLPLKDPERQQQLNAYYSLRDQLVQHLSILEHFPGCLSKKHALPHQLYEIEKENLQRELNRFVDDWNRRMPADLLAMIARQAKSFMAPPDAVNPSYRELEYLTLLFRKLRALSLSCPADAGTAVVHLLICFNFNHPDFVHYALRHLHPLPSEEGIAGDLMALLQWRLALKKLRPQTKHALLRRMPPCLAALLQLIGQEIQLLEKQRMAGSEQAHTGKAETAETQSTFKTCLTISQLGLFLRLLNNTGMLTCNPLSILFDQVARHIGTIRSTNYSSTSLKTGYYTDNSIAKSLLKDYIIEMLNELKRA